MRSSAVLDSPIKALCERGIAACASASYREALQLLELAAAEIGNPASLPARALACYGVAISATDRKRTSDGVRFSCVAIERNTKVGSLAHHS